MATLIEYFNTDFQNAQSFAFTLNASPYNVDFQIKVCIDLDSNAKFAVCHIPNNENLLHILLSLLKSIENIIDENKISMRSGYSADLNFGQSKNIINVFSNRIYIYTERGISENESVILNELCSQKSFLLTLRGDEYVKHRNEIARPLAFISHDSRDKETVALPIAMGLIGMQCPVWYDEFSLNVGDKLRDSIEKGMKETKKCILILSNNFITNGGWTKTEFDSIFTREIVNKETVILPVWCGVTQKDIYEYSPSLADRMALNWDKLGKDDVVHRLHQAIRACSTT